MRIPNTITKAIKDNLKKGSCVALTGAGISVESGIPPFRGKGGLWEKYKPETFAYTKGLINTLRNQPEQLADFVNDFYGILLDAEPNPAHFALTSMQKNTILKSIITQNIDNLHQASGASDVVELHGNSYRIRCGECFKQQSLDKEQLKEMCALLSKNKKSYKGILKVLSRYFPHCKCGGRFRIDIVLFGEVLPEEALAKAYRELDKCRLLFLVGTSGMVQPASSLPLYAKEGGAKIIEINSARTALSDLCDYTIIGPASESLAEILRISGLDIL